MLFKSVNTSTAFPIEIKLNPPPLTLFPFERRGGLRGPGSIRHILHTFRPEERLGLSSVESDLAPALAHAPQSLDEEPGTKSIFDREASRDGRRDMEAGEVQGDHDRISPGRRDSGIGVGSSGRGAGASGIRRALMWRSRWIYRDKRALPLEADELQVEVSQAFEFV